MLRLMKVLAIATLFDVASTEVYLGVRDYVVPDDDVSIQQLVDFHCLRWVHGHRICPVRELPI